MRGEHGRTTLQRLYDLMEINEETGCWDWAGFRKPNGYGQFDRNKYAHRVMYQELVGEIPDGMVVDHLCRNRACVNPKHMEIVTPRENLRRGDGWSGRHARKTHCIRGHLLAGDNLSKRARVEGGRECRECRRIRQRENYAARRSGVGA